jgi:hypothetical protein
MIDDKTMKAMPKVEMVRCEVTGKLFPATECEVVIIKIIKSKSADINSYSPFVGATNSVGKIEVVDKGKPATDVPVVDTSSPEYSKGLQRRMSVIPAAMKDLFQKPPEVS